MILKIWLKLVRMKPFGPENSQTPNDLKSLGRPCGTYCVTICIVSNACMPSFLLYFFFFLLFSTYFSVFFLHPPFFPFPHLSLKSSFFSSKTPKILIGGTPQDPLGFLPLCFEVLIPKNERPESESHIIEESIDSKADKTVNKKKKRQK